MVRHSGMTTVPVKQTTRRGLLRRVRMRRDLAAMEKRRMCAADLFERGVIPAEIARQLGVSHQIVSDWRAAWRRSGRDGLRGADRTGRPPKVSHEQLVQLEAELLKGGEANGYPNELWTLQRVAEVIERMTGVAYHPARVWHLLREGLGWSWQRPARRAIERDDEAIQRWVRRRWPALKKGQGARTR
jgi:transposase